MTIDEVWIVWYFSPTPQSSGLDVKVFSSEVSAKIFSNKLGVIGPVIKRKRILI